MEMSGKESEIANCSTNIPDDNSPTMSEFFDTMTERKQQAHGILR